jgi:hypothetical protein
MFPQTATLAWRRGRSQSPAWIHYAVKGENRRVTVWKVEAGVPSILPLSVRPYVASRERSGLLRRLVILGGGIGGAEEQLPSIGQRDIGAIRPVVPGLGQKPFYNHLCAFGQGILGHTASI